MPKPGNEKATIGLPPRTRTTPTGHGSSRTRSNKEATR